MHLPDKLGLWKLILSKNLNPRSKDQGPSRGLLISCYLAASPSSLPTARPRHPLWLMPSIISLMTRYPASGWNSLGFRCQMANLWVWIQLTFLNCCTSQVVYFLLSLVCKPKFLTVGVRVIALLANNGCTLSRLILYVHLWSPTPSGYSVAAA